nr:SsrA-binding protein [uncultured Spongiibacter sp.]
MSKKKPNNSSTIALNKKARHDYHLTDKLEAGVSLLGWDMMDSRPDPYGLAFPMHGVLFNYGVALLDNALLEPLADACAEEDRYEFMFMGLPLKVARGTGSPANPVAMF